MINIRAKRKTRKQLILTYCLNTNRKTWLLDSAQIFDPYWMAKKDTKKTRETLQALQISRPFTIWQLKSKVYSLRKLVGRNDIVIISSMTIEDEQVSNDILQIIQELPCEVILGWEEPLCQSAGRWKHNCKNLEDTSKPSEKTIEYTLKNFMQM